MIVDAGAAIVTVLIQSTVFIAQAVVIEIVVVAALHPLEYVLLPFLYNGDADRAAEALSARVAMTPYA